MDTRILLISLIMLMSCGNPKAATGATAAAGGAIETAVDTAHSVRVGAQRIDQYMPMLQGKKVGLYSNHTGIVAPGKHTLDQMLEHNVDVECVFSPEHGFRGTADAGEAVGSSVDEATGVKIVSLYGSGRAKALEEAIDGLDVVVVDIQDVGLRFYTYYCTMLEIMNAAAERGKQIVVLDRPNPNGMYVDGPILDMKYASGVGRLPIPVVHGLTLGEMALMANGEGWLKDGKKVDLTVVPCEGYTHQTRYALPVAPSPNLQTMHAIYLYPSICYFEATDVSLGRGTDHPFEIYGHPKMEGRTYDFTPTSRPGAKTPPQLNVLCHGVDLTGIPDEEIIAKGINLEYLIDAYTDLKDTGKPFFTSFFEKLIGKGDIRSMIEQGMTADQIKATWAADVEAFKQQRKPYLLYEE